MTASETDVIAQFPQQLQRIWVLSQLMSVLIAHRIDDEVGMWIVCVAVRADQHLMTRPRFCRKLQRNLMSIDGRDGIPRIKGLCVLIKIHPVQLAKTSLCQHELTHRILSIAVDTGDQIPPADGIVDFEFLLAVINKSLHGADALLLLTDISHRCHKILSVILRS